MPSSFGTAKGSTLLPGPSAEGQCTTTLILNVLTMSCVTTSGAPMITSSTNLHESTLSERSWRLRMGWCGPRVSVTTSSLWIPTRIKSPSSRAALSASMWPAWNMSKTPGTYTMRSFGPGARQLENCMMRREVGQKCDSCVFFDVDDTVAAPEVDGVVCSSCEAECAGKLSYESPTLIFFCKGEGLSDHSGSGCARVLRSMRPTMSVLETPSVLLIILKRPSFLAAA
mmetsp:Transcript_4371/g.15164  ORF Transcript_4371/g.15164 Transcript_4371/m.15164 type:complete len:227 (-) Transcript_4371:529-1209(-)